MSDIEWAMWLEMLWDIGWIVAGAVLVAYAWELFSRCRNKGE